jgi:hypothetical protein
MKENHAWCQEQGFIGMLKGAFELSASEIEDGYDGKHI